MREGVREDSPDRLYMDTIYIGKSALSLEPLRFDMVDMAVTH